MKLSLCWTCQNTNRFKCPWFDPVNPKPVAGWDAVRKDVRITHGRRVESYFVRSCPNYVAEEERKLPDNGIPQCSQAGVRWGHGKWVASLTVKNQYHHLGSFAKMEDAIAARKEAERRLKVDA